MLYLHWLSRLWSPREREADRRPRSERVKERRLRLMRLEQRRVLNADFSLTAHGLSLSHVDGDVIVREVQHGAASHLEFDLAGSVWQDDGSTGVFSIDNSVAGHSILSVAKSDLEQLPGGVSLIAAASEFDLHLDAQTSSLDLSRLSGVLVAEGFGTIQQSSDNDFDVRVGDVSLSAERIELSSFRGDDIMLAASEIDLTGGAGSLTGSTLAITSAGSTGIELGGLSDDGADLNFTDRDIAALSSGFTSIEFGGLESSETSHLIVDDSGADFGDALTSLHSNEPSGSLRLSAAEIQIHGELHLNGGTINVEATDLLSLTASGAVVNHGGHVELDAGHDGTLLIAGEVDVSDSDADGIGGSAHLFGDQIGLWGDARVDASGAAGGGEVLIGGDAHGVNSAIDSATHVWIGAEVEVHADALHHGNGGDVVVWSDQATQHFGTLTARGGVFGGDGGFIETSSRGQLILSGSGDASAAHGDGGTWLLDPFNVTIRHTLSGLGVDDSGQLPNFTPTASGSEITDTAIETQLNAGTSVVISTANVGGAEAGNVTQTSDASIDVVFTAVGNSATFTINAANNIQLDGGITVSNGTLDVVLNANTVPDDPDLSAGNVEINSAVNTNGGAFTASGVNFNSSGATITATGGVTLIQAGTVVLGAINTGTGALDVTAGGNITDDGAVTVGGNASFTTTQSNADITLDLLQLTGTLSLSTIGNNGDATIVNGTGINFAATSIEGNLTATATSGDITDSGTVIVGHEASFTTSQINDDILLDQLQLTGSLTLSTTGANADATIVNATGLNFAATNVGNDLTATATTGSITDLGTIIVGGDARFVTAQAGDDIDLNLLQLTGTLSLSTTGATGHATVVNATGINFATTDVGGDLAVTASTGGITDTAPLSVGGNARFETSAGGDITIAALGSVHFGSLTFNTLGEVSIAEDSATVLSGVSTAARLSLTSSELLSNDSTASVTVDDNVTVRGTSISLGEQIGDVFRFGSLSFASAGAVGIAEDDSLQLSGLSSAASLNLLSGDTISDDGTAGVSIAGSAAFSGTSITLNDFLQFGSVKFTSSGAVLISEADGTLLEGTSTAASLDLRSQDTITNSGTANVAVSGNARFEGTQVTLGDQAGDAFQFGSVTFQSTGAVRIAEDSDTTFSGVSDAQSLSVRSNGEVTNAPLARLTIDDNAAFSGTLITLGQQAGDVFRFGSLTFDADAAVQIAQDSDVVLSGNSSGASLTLQSTDTIRTDGTANVVIDNNATFLGTRITLSDVQRFGTLTFVSSGEVAISEADATDLIGTSSALSLNLSSSDAIRNRESAHLTVENNAALSGTSIELGDQLGDAMNFGSLTLNASDDVHIEEDSDILLSGVSTAQNLDLRSSDVLMNDGSASLTVADNARFRGTNIDLGNQSGDAMSFGSLTFDAEGFARIASDTAVVLSGTSEATTLDLQSDAELTDDGTAQVSIVSNAQFTAASITLDDDYFFGSLTFVSTGAVVIVESDATLLSDISSALSLQLTSTESIDNDGSANVTVTNNATFHAPSIALTDTYRFGTLTFTSAGLVEIIENDAMRLEGNSSANSLSLTSNSSISEAVGGTLTVTETSDLVAASGGIVLDGANDFGGVVTLASGDVATLNDINSVTFGDSIVAAALDVTADDSIQLDGNLSASSASLLAMNGSISGGGRLTAATVDLDARTGIFGVSSNDALTITSTNIAADNGGAADVRLSNDSPLGTTVTSLTTLGGDLVFDQTGFGAVTFTGAVASGDQGATVPVTGGNITLSSNNGLTLAEFADPLSSESGSGGSLLLSGATILRAIRVGAGDITINGGGDDLLIAGDIFANSSIELSATEDVIIRSTVTANGAGSDLTITADSDFDGAGGFWLDEGPVASDARLVAGQNITIQGSSLLATTTSGDGIRIHDDGGAVQVVAGADLLLSTIAGAAASNSGDIILNGPQSAEGTLTVRSNSETFLGADQFAGFEMLFQSAVRLTDDVTLTSVSDLIFTSTVDDDGSGSTGSALTIDAGEDVVFSGAVGAIVGDRLDSLTVADSESVTFLSTVTIDGDLTVVTTLSSGATAGAISFADDVVTTTGSASGSVRITNAGLLIVAPNADFLLAGAFLQDGDESTELGGDITTLNGSITFERGVLLTETVQLDSSNRSGDITILGPVDSEGGAGSGEHNSLMLTSGTGAISFNGDIGAGSLGDQTLGDLRVLTAGTVIFGGADAGGLGTPGPVTAIATDGVIDIGVGDRVIAGGIVLNAGSGTLFLTTTDDSVRFNGPVTLSSLVEIDTNFSGIGGVVTFTSNATVDSKFGESNGLTIDAGAQRVLFNNDVGLINAIGPLTITQADSGVIFGESDANQGPGSTGPVTTLATEGPIDIGVGSNVIVGGIVFNAGNGTLQISAADDTIRLNGAVTLNSNVRINTNTSGGGTVTFTSDATIDSQTGEHRDLTIDAGTQQVLFNNDLGAVESLGALTITQADGGVIFGESDTNLGPGLTGPVRIISTDGAIDIGVEEHVITGGIVLNAGSDPFVIVTTDDSVRLNGPVTLASHLDINTNFTGIGGTVTFTNAASIDSETGEHNDLRINAGGQQVAFNENIGETQSLGALTITQADSGVTFGQPVTFGASDVDQRPGTTGPVSIINTDDAIDIGVGGNVIGGSGIVLNAGADMLTITTTDDTVRFNGAVTLASGVTIDTNETGLGGTVTFTSAATIDSQTDEHNDLIVDAGSQQVLFNNNLGAFVPLGTFTILQAESGVFFGESDTDQGPGSTGPVAIISTDGDIDIGVGANVIAGSGIVLNAGTQTLQITTTDDTVRFNGQVTLQSSLDIDTNDTGVGGTVTFTSAATIDGEFGEQNNLTIDAGQQQVLFNNDIGNHDPIGSLIVTQADGGVVFGQDDADQGPGTTGPVTTIITEGLIDIGVGANVITGGIVFNAGDGVLLVRTTDDTARLNGPVTLRSAVEISTNLTPLTGGGTVTFTSAATIDSEPDEHNDLTIDAGSQQVLFNNNIGLNNPIGALVITQADAGVIFGQTDTDLGPGTTGPVMTVATDGEINIGVGPNVVTGGIQLNAGTGTLNITTTDDSVRLNGPVTLLTDVDINSNINGNGGGTVTFTSAATIDSQTGETNDLAIDAGLERVNFNNNLGATQALGALTITQADSGVIFGETDTDEGPGTTGPVQIINTDDAIDIGVGANEITFGIVLNAGIDEFGVQRTQQITTTDDTIRFNGPVTLSTAVNIDTHFTAVTGGATVTFTSGATVDSQADEHNDLTIDVGTQQVLFNNDVGGIFSLGAFTIVQADTGVIFGEADTDLGPGTIGPVTTISADREINLGVGSNVLDGSVGIVLNAGTDTLRVMTTDDNVRFNGAITLNSPVEIDTNFEILTGGGNVLFTSNTTIDSQTDEFNDLTIDAGIREVLFNNNLGATQAIGALTIVQANGGVTFGENDVNLGPGTIGPVTTIATDGGIDIGVLGNIINGGVLLNGGDDTLLMSSTDDPIRINGQVTLGSDVVIDSNDIGFGGTVTFTSSATIDSQGDEQRTLTIDAGAQQVLFNNNVGENVPLGSLTIVQADGGITFGESGTDLGAGTTGPVSTVTTVGPMDLGVDDNVIFGGIVLNGGLSDITIESLEDRIRVNGPVTSFVDSIWRAAEGITLTDEADFDTTDHNIEMYGDTNDTRVDDPFTDAIEMGFDTVIDSGDGYIRQHAASILLGQLISTNTGATTDEHPAIHVTATTGAIIDVNSDIDAGFDSVNFMANEPGAGVVLDAVTGIGSGDALETEVDTLQARNMDQRDADGLVLVPSLGNIQIVEVPSGGDLNLINVRNEANATFDADPDNGVIDVLIERDPDEGAIDGSLTVLDDELGGIDATNVPYGLLAELKGDPLMPVIPEDRNGVQSENIIRLTAFNVTINDDVVAVTDADGGTTYGTIEIRARGDFALAANRVITTDENFPNSLPAGDPTLAEPDSGDPPSEFPIKPRVTDDRVRIVADFDFDEHVDAGNVFLGRSSTISTDAGVEQLISRRPAPNEAGTAFFDSTTVDTSDLNTNGLDANGTKYLGFMTIVIGKPGEKNLILDVDWGDTPRSVDDLSLFPPNVQELIANGTIRSFNEIRESKISDEVGMSANVLADSNVNPPSFDDGKYFFDKIADKNKTRFFIPEGGLTYVIPHEYSSLALNRPEDLREPGRTTPSDPFQVRFSVSQHASINIQGRAVHEHTIGPASATPLAAVGASSPIAPLALLSSTDILEDNVVDDHEVDYTPRVEDGTPNPDFYRDEPNFRLNSGVAEFNVPTNKPFTFIDNTTPVAPPEPPKAVIPPSISITASNLTTESLRGSAASTSVTTDEFFELHLINEDGSTTVERLKDGEGLLERERFESFVRERGDGDYEIWFITRENGTGARIERPVIQFRLEGGRLTPASNDASTLIKPFRLVPVPEAPPKPMPDADGMSDDAMSDDEQPDASIESNSEVPPPSSDLQDGTTSMRWDIPSRHESPVVVASEPASFGEVEESESSAEQSSPAQPLSLVAGVLFATSSRWRKSRSSQPASSPFSLAARLARKRRILPDDQ